MPQLCFELPAGQVSCTCSVLPSSELKPLTGSHVRQFFCSAGYGGAGPSFAAAVRGDAAAGLRHAPGGAANGLHASAMDTAGGSSDDDAMSSDGSGEEGACRTLVLTMARKLAPLTERTARASTC